jgi:hypothetical protein
MRYVVVEFGSDCPHCQSDEDVEDDTGCDEVPGVYGMTACLDGLERVALLGLHDRHLQPLILAAHEDFRLAAKLCSVFESCHNCIPLKDPGAGRKSQLRARTRGWR